MAILLPLILCSVVGDCASSEELFFFEIVGTLSDWWLISEPEPSNHTLTGTTAHRDVPGIQTLAIRLVYNGSTTCQITQICVWQEIVTFGKTWNWAGTFQITPPSEFSPAMTFDFLVEAPMHSFLVEGVVYVKLVTREFGDLVLSSDMPKHLEKLDTWPLPSKSTTSNIWGFNFFGIFCASVIIITIRRTINSK